MSFALREYSRQVASRITAHRLWRRAIDEPRYAIKLFFSLPAWPPRSGYRLTPRKLFNFYLSRYEACRGRTALRSRPWRLTVEANNLCNLRCPACFTGVGEQGRRYSHMSLELFDRLLDELAPYLFAIDFFNWGEPMLAKHIYPMVEKVNRHGIATTINTNFSVPFDVGQAERLVRSGLTTLGVSIDGARQETYEQYRVRGNLELVLANCRLVRDAKRRLGSDTPRMIWGFHVFKHNVDDIEPAKSLAAELEMDIAIEKGWVNGPDWDTEGRFSYFLDPRPSRCPFLWGHAVVNNDGGVAPCCGTFYREDDRGQIAVKPGEPGDGTFRQVWNSAKFQTARRFFESRSGSDEERKDICFDCPVTIAYDEYRQHRAGGGAPSDFHLRFTLNDSWNYFFGRRPDRPSTRRGAAPESLPAVSDRQPASG